MTTPAAQLQRAVQDSGVLHLHQVDAGARGYRRWVVITDGSPPSRAFCREEPERCVRIRVR